MAYTDDAVKAKLSALNETQDSIVTVAQWVMFHRRHAEKTAQLWLQRLRDSGAPKRLNLVYLVNEVVQQSKARRKEDFLIAFSPIIADATSVAYKGATNDVQQKLRRVVEVWRQRAIFETPIQDAVESRIDEIDKSRSSGRKPLMGGSLFSGGGALIPSELQPLAPLQTGVSKATIITTAAVSNANGEYDKLVDPNTPVPTPPVHAARLSALMKTLANAEGAVAESIKAREALISGLEKLLDTNRAALEKEKAQATEFADRKNSIESKKREVEDGIMRGLTAEEEFGTFGNGGSPHDDEDRPDVEALTPPAADSLTPVGSPTRDEAVPPPAEILPKEPTPTPTYAPPSSVSPPTVQPSPAIPSILSSLTVPSVPVHLLPQHSPSQSPPNGMSNASLNMKKRKMSHPGYDDEPEFTGDAMADLDADVAELLRQESGGKL